MGNEVDYPICCDEFMAKCMDAPVFKFECPPSGHYYPTVGKTCGTEEEYLREARKVRENIDNQRISDENKIRRKKEQGIDLVT